MYIITETKRSDLPDDVFGIPEERKYPLETKDHVYSAVKLFNHVDKKYEKELAENIIKKIDEYGIDDIHPGESNRFSKYFNDSVEELTQPTIESVEDLLPVTEKIKFVVMTEDELIAKAKEFQKSSDKNVKKFGDCIITGFANGFKDINSVLSCINMLLFLGGATLAVTITTIVGLLLFFTSIFPFVLISSLLKKQRNFLNNTLKKHDPNVKRYFTATSAIINQGGDFTEITMESLVPVLEAPMYDKVDWATAPGFYDQDNVWNAIDIVDGKPYRSRVECLILKDDKLYLWKKPDGTYKIPGGSKTKGVDDIIQCENECMEEARIKTKNMRYVLSYHNEEPMAKWAVDKNMPKWFGKNTDVYVAEWAGRYSGYIHKLDRDDILKYGDFYTISDIYSILKPEHKSALKKYGINLNNVTESLVPVLEAPGDEDDEEDTATDYGAELDDTDGEEEPDDDTDTQNDEPEADNTDDTGEDTPEEETDDTDQTGEEDTPEEDEATDYGAEMGDDTGEDDTTTDDTTDDAETSDTMEETPEDDETNKNNIIKNYNLMIDFKRMHESISELLKNLDQVIFQTPIQNSVISQIIKNLDKEKEEIMTYITFHFDSKYEINLYYYNIFVQALKFNLEMMRKNAQLDEDKQTNN